MREHKQTIIHLFVAAALLFGVSAYRQFSLHYWPQDMIRPYIVYAVYMLLAGWWQYAISAKILQKNMCIHLTAQNIVSMLYLTVRFIQDAYLYDNIPLMRFTGYFINIPAILIPLLGLYAAFYLGKGEDYQINWRWYLLLIPAAILTVMALTNDYHHFLYYVVPEEPQPNLYFHPYIGTGLIYLWALGIIGYQVYAIEKRSGAQHAKKLVQKLIPVYEPVLLFLFSVPYIAGSYIVQFEIVEYSAGMIFIIIFCWELYILTGLIPVNTRYDEVFRRSTIAMQILDTDGHRLARSEDAMALTPDHLSALVQDGHLSVDDIALHLHKTENRYVIWQNDLTSIHQSLKELQEINMDLEHEKELLEKEIQIRSEESLVQTRNEIYDKLAAQTTDQFMLLQELLDRSSDNLDLWGRICLVGMYIKRFCNLQIIYHETGQIPNQDLQISLNDMITCMERIGIPASLDFRPKESLDPELILYTMKGLQMILEKTDFSLKMMNIRIAETVCYDIACENIDFDSFIIDDPYWIEAVSGTDYYRLRLVKKSEVEIA